MQLDSVQVVESGGAGEREAGDVGCRIFLLRVSDFLVNGTRRCNAQVEPRREELRDTNNEGADQQP